jgi:peptidoglycan/LPS O-acetylase OafA/YrhL
MINLVKVRLSNIELLRILSMLGVLIVHADFGALGEPTRTELLSTPHLYGYSDLPGGFRNRRRQCFCVNFRMVRNQFPMEQPL